jgi:AcrR family transcriptional regulator
MQRGEHRGKILAVATELFYRNGIHATGIDTIIAQSDIARMTLYKHFPSKDSLIEAVLRKHAEDARQLLESIVKQTEKTPEERLWLLFEAVDQTVQTPEFFGCPFINATAEYSDLRHPFHRLAVEYKQMYRDYIFQIVEQLNVADPAALTSQLFLLIEGTLVAAQVDAQQRTSEEALAAAHILVDFHRRK